MALPKKLQMCELRDLILTQVYVQRVKGYMTMTDKQVESLRLEKTKNRKNKWKFKSWKIHHQKKKSSGISSKETIDSSKKKRKFDDKSVEII